MHTQTIATICGSLRKESLNRAIINTLPELAPEGMTFFDVPSFGDFPIYNTDFQNSDGFPAAVTAFGDAIRSADGVIIVSPEYNYSIPGGLKNAIDWASRLSEQPIAGKPFALQSAAAGMLGGARMQYHLRQAIGSLEGNVFTKPEVFVTFGNKKVENGKLIDEAVRDVISSQLAAFATFVARFQ